MSVVGGLDVANNDLATNELFFANRNQAALAKTSSQLASGLAIESPADDPAGYTQAQNTEVVAKSLDEASVALQNTQSALNVASGALSTITAIVQRIRDLCVSANNTELSTTDITNIQTEIAQLNTEVNTICANTQFNGVPLFRGTTVAANPTVVQSVDSYFGAVDSPELTTVTVNLNTQPIVGDVLVAAVAHGDGYGGGGGVAVVTAPAGWTLQQIGDDGFNDGLAIYTHVATATDTTADAFTVTNTIPGNNVNVDITEFTSVAPVNPVVTSALQQNPYVHPVQPDPSPPVTAVQNGDVAISLNENNNTYAPGDGLGVDWTEISQNYQIFNALEVQISNPATAGQTLASSLNFHPIGLGDAYSGIVLVAPGTAAQGYLYTTQSGAGEGETLQVTIAGFTSQLLGLNDVDVTQSATASEGFCDNALTSLIEQQSALGSVISAAAQYAENNQVASTNVTASASSITDLNVARASTQFEKEQLLNNFTTTLLAQSSDTQQGLLQLFR